MQAQKPTFFTWGYFPHKFDKAYLKEEKEYFGLQRSLLNRALDAEGLFREGCERTRRLTARLLNIEDAVDHIVFDGSVLRLLSDVLDTFVSREEEVVTTDAEFTETYRKLTARNLTIRIARVYGARSSSDVVNSMSDAVTARTRVAIVSDVLWNVGLKIPIAQVAREVKRKCPGAFVIVDGAQAFGHVSVDLSGDDVDVYVADFHKWICSMAGAFVFIRDPSRLAGFVDRSEGAFSVTKTMDGSRSSYDGLAFALAATHKALQPFLSQRVQEVLRSNSTRLSRMLRTLLEPLDPLHFKILPPVDLDTGILSLVGAERSLYDYLRRRRLVCNYIPGFRFQAPGTHELVEQPACLRIMLNDKPGGNTEKDVQRLASAIGEFCAKERSPTCIA